jgi:hypothetical protein
VKRIWIRSVAPSVSVGLVALAGGHIRCHRTHLGTAFLDSHGPQINLSYSDFCGKRPIAEVLRFAAAAGTGAGLLGGKGAGLGHTVVAANTPALRR